MDNDERTQVQNTRLMMFGFDIPSALLFGSDQLDDVISYCEELSVFIDRTAATFKTRVEARAKSQGLTGANLDAYYEHHSYKATRWESTYPLTLRSSALLAGWLTLESLLTAVCKEIEQHEKIAISTKWSALPKRETGVSKCARFLKTNFRLAIKTSALWEDIDAILKIRNCIAHSSGNVELMNPTHRDATCDAVGKLSARPGKISIRMDGRIQFDQKSLRATLATLGKFWEEVVDGVRRNRTLGPLFWEPINQ